MVVDGVIPLMESGAIAPRAGSIFSGVALGSADLYARAGEDPAFQFGAVNETHDFRRLSAIENLVAINSALEIDLSGQVNAEAVGTQQVSGAGGIADFLRGAAAAPGGRGIIGLASTAKSGALSRIVPTLGAGVPVTVPRNDVSLVVTEHGIADLRNKTLTQRADALIAIADPAHRPALEQARQCLS
jgi:acyl-CoA hydrolase